MDSLADVFNLDKVTLKTIGVFVLTWIFAYLCVRRPLSLPPGPPFVPILGNLLSFAVGDVIANLDNLRRKYGDVYGLYFGRELTVFINGYDAIHEALVRNGSLFLMRPYDSIFHKLFNANSAIIFTNGQLWKRRRRFMEMVLQEICFKNRAERLETYVQEESGYLLAQVAEIDCPFDVTHYIKISTANIVLRVICNQRAEFSNESILDLLADIHNQGCDYGRSNVLVNCFPFLRFLPFDVLGIERFQERELKMVETLTSILQQKKEVGCETDGNISFVDLYDKRIQESFENDTDDIFNEEEKYRECLELLSAGSETTSSVMAWTLLFLIHHPEVQERMVAEMDEAIGKETSPSLEHKPSLPYCHAVILEGIRISNVAPLAVPHTVPRDIIFRGFTIPENTMVLFNLGSPWSHDNEFKPERFIDKQTAELVCPKELIPFGLGPRSCLGESIARIELFLFVTSFIQKFRVTGESEGHLPSLKGNLGLTYSPSPFKIRVFKRSL